MTSMNTVNTSTTVTRIIRRLGDAGVPCILFGGWAEETLGLRKPRPHADIDLLLHAPSFETLDALLAAPTQDLQEVPLKRFAHKRAFLFSGALTEVILVQQEDRTP